MLKPTAPSFGNGCPQIMQVMQKHQKYFAITDDSGRLLPYFITVSHAFQLMMLSNMTMANVAWTRVQHDTDSFRYKS